MDIGKKTDRIIIITIICIAVFFTFLSLKPGGKAAKDTVPGASAAADTSENEGQGGIYEEGTSSQIFENPKR